MTILILKNVFHEVFISNERCEFEKPSGILKLVAGVKFKNP